VEHFLCSPIHKCGNLHACFQYIALEKLESTYKACNYVANICIHASPDAKQPIAIIIPHEANLRPAIKASNLTADVDSTLSLAQLCENQRVNELVLKACNAIGKKNGFKSMEFLQAVILTPEEWTPESGLVTAAQKIQRNKIAKKFEAGIKVFLSTVLLSNSALMKCYRRLMQISNSRYQISCLE
jgi:long-chain acyl-CoA synthetase